MGTETEEELVLRAQSGLATPETAQVQTAEVSYLPVRSEVVQDCINCGYEMQQDPFVNGFYRCPKCGDEWDKNMIDAIDLP